MIGAAVALSLVAVCPLLLLSMLPCVLGRVERFDMEGFIVKTFFDGGWLDG